MNPSIVESAIGSAGKPASRGDRDSTIFHAVNTFLAMLKVNDALLRISRTISDRRRRAAECGSDQRWWPDLNRDLHKKYVVPLIEELTAFQPKDGYDSNATMFAVQKTASALTLANKEVPLPPIRSELQLVEDYLQPAFSRLATKIGGQGADLVRVAILGEIAKDTFREWLKKGSGRELVSYLERLVATEPRLPPKLRITDDQSLFGMPGVVVELSREDAEKWGAFEEDALTEEDAWETQADSVSYSMVELTARKLGWYECETEAKSILLAVNLAQQRLDGKRTSGSHKASLQTWHFCELCDGLVELSGHEAVAAASKSSRFCKTHSSARSRSGKSPGHEVSWYISTLLQEAYKDPDYKRRFVEGLDDGELLAEIVDHTNACDFCSGRSIRPECLDPSKRYFAGLMAFHANVRKVAHKIANSYYSSIAWMIDRAVQEGRCAREYMGSYRLDTDKAVGQYSGLALARLLFQKVTGVEIAARLGISPSAVSQRRSALTGCFDFAPRRNPSLVWWPFDDIAGNSIIKFPARALGEGWRHSTGEYHHLARPSGAFRETHLRVARSSSLPTKSSARR